MAARGIAKRYAQAVFDLARESNSVDAWLAQLTRLAGIANDDVAGAFFTSPSVDTADKHAAITTFLPGAENQEARNLALLLIQRRRFDILPDILEVFEGLVLESQGIAVADVTTAVQLSDAEQAEVAQRLSSMIGQRVQVRTKVDPSIIGGIVARVGDRLIDGSVESQLRSLRARVAR